MLYEATLCIYRIALVLLASCCVLTGALCAAGAQQLETQSNQQKKSCNWADSPGSSGSQGLHLAAAILPAHGISFEPTKTAHDISTLAKSLIIITPDGTTFDDKDFLDDDLSSTKGIGEPSSILQHSITWAGDSSAALNAAAKAAEAAGAAWLLTATAGDRAEIEDNSQVVQQLAASNKAVLFCHKAKDSPEAKACLYKLPLKGQFLGPVHPILIPESSAAVEYLAAPSSNSSSTDTSSELSSSSSSACNDALPASSTSIHVPGIILSQSYPSHARLKGEIAALRKYLSSEPSNKAWWLLQLAENFERLGKKDMAKQHYQQCYDASSSRQLAAWAMYKLAQLHIRDGDMQGSLSTAAQGLARHAGPELLWLASYVAYQLQEYKRSLYWAQMAASVGCINGTCDNTTLQHVAFADLDTWYEKPFDVLKYAHSMLGDGARQKEAGMLWEAAEQQRHQNLQERMFVVGGIQMLALTPHKSKLLSTFYSMPEAAPPGQVTLVPPPIVLSQSLMLWGVSPVPLGPPANHNYLAASIMQEDLFITHSTAAKPRIAFSMTTAHRPELFKRSWNSFRSRCLDCDAYVTKWYVVDDGSSPQVLAAMQRTAPPCIVTWLNKTSLQNGHVGSLNRILDEVYADGYDYLLHVEDDWHFFVEDDFITKALRIMDHDKAISQVLFNPNYADTDAEWEMEDVAPGQMMMTADGLEYMLHVHAGPLGSHTHKLYMEKLGGKLSNCHWPGFSLRPGLWRLSAIRTIGRFEDVQSFEETFALKVHAAGFKTAFFSKPVSIHLAPTAGWLQSREKEISELYAKHGLRLQHSAGHQKSAYDSNLSGR